MIATAGTSTIIPAVRFRSLISFATHFASVRVETIGTITQFFPVCSRAAWEIASNWRVKSSWSIPVVLRPLTPSAGLGSASRVAQEIGLSEPASRVRVTTFLSGKAENTRE